MTSQQQRSQLQFSRITHSFQAIQLRGDGEAAALLETSLQSTVIIPELDPGQLGIQKQFVLGGAQAGLEPLVGLIQGLICLPGQENGTGVDLSLRGWLLTILPSQRWCRIRNHPKPCGNSAGEGQDQS